MMTRVFIGDSHHTHVCVNFQHRRRTFRNMGLLCDIEVYYNLFFRLLLPRESQNRSEKKIVLGLYASVIFLLEEGGRGFRVSLLTLLTRDFRDCNHDCAIFYTKKKLSVLQICSKLFRLRTSIVHWPTAFLSANLSAGISRN